ncbi:MAG: transglutaminase family protein [Verrucomicrobia bacterium]|nr:transglutaminase family protein [Verrucomicrobiota bacterium]
MPTATAAPATEPQLVSPTEKAASPASPATNFGPNAAPELDLLVRAGCEFVYYTAFPTPLFLTLTPRQTLFQHLEVESQKFDPPQAVYEYEDAHGNIIHRVRLQPGLNTIRHDSLVRVPSVPENVEGFGPPVPVEELPDHLLRYTLPSRYCDSDKLLDFAFEKFGQVPHGRERVQAICDWVHHNIEYRTFSGSPTKSAADTVADGFGVCRDFAHTALTLCRTFNLPARYVTGYVADIAFQDSGTPMDFHAYFEVYLGHRWHTFDARFNVPRIGRIKIAHGLDAVDGAFATFYGQASWRKFEVWSYQVDPADPTAATIEAPVDLSKRLCGTPRLIVPGRQ